MLNPKEQKKLFNKILNQINKNNKKSLGNIDTKCFRNSNKTRSQSDSQCIYQGLYDLDIKLLK